MLILISQYAHQSGDSDQKMQHCLDWAGQHATGLIMSNSKVWIDMNSELSSTIYDSYTFLESCLSNNQKHTYLVSYEMVDRYLICDSFKCDKLFRLTHVHWVQKKTPTGLDSNQNIQSIQRHNNVPNPARHDHSWQTNNCRQTSNLLKFHG